MTVRTRALIVVHTDRWEEPRYVEVADHWSEFSTPAPTAGWALRRACAMRDSGEHRGLYPEGSRFSVMFDRMTY